MSRRFWALWEWRWAHNRRMARAGRIEQEHARSTPEKPGWRSAFTRWVYYRAEHERRLCRRYHWKPEPWAVCGPWIPANWR